MEKQQPSLLESYYAEVEKAFPSALARLAEESGFKGGELGEIILEATSLRGDGFALLCELDAGCRLQISGRTANELLFGAGNARFDQESLDALLVQRNRFPVYETMVLDGQENEVLLGQFSQNHGRWGIIFPGFIDTACAEISLEKYPDLYPGCNSVEEVARKISLGSVRRLKAGIVTMVKNTWGE